MLRARVRLPVPADTPCTGQALLKEQTNRGDWNSAASCAGSPVGHPPVPKAPTQPLVTLLAITPAQCQIQYALAQHNEQAEGTVLCHATRTSAVTTASDVKLHGVQHTVDVTVLLIESPTRAGEDTDWKGIGV